MVKKIVLSFLLLVFGLSIVVTDVSAIPAFARKYKFSCTTCHAPFPRLKEFGDEFAGNGFRLPGKEPKRYFYDVGDGNLQLMRKLPLAVRLDFFASAEPDKNVVNDLKTPYNLKLLSGGNVYKNIGYYFYFYMSERGEVVGIEDAYIHFDDLFHSGVDVMAGQFQISDPLFKRELRLTYEDYQIYKTRIALSPANLTYDRGLFMTYSTPFQTDLVLEVVNGNGKDPASPATRAFDEDDNKNFFFRGSQSLLGQRVGAFAYLGKEDTNGRENAFQYWGVDATFSLPKLELNLQYLRRHDDNPYFLSAIYENNMAGGLAELIFPATDKLYFIGLYNRIYSDPIDLNYTTLTFNVSYLYRTNLRFLAEFTRDFERESSRFVAGIVTGF